MLNVDYQVEFVAGYGDRAVIILANPPPLRPWLFEAFDGDTHAPGDIHYIKIADGVTVGDIQLGVVGNPNSTPPHEFGARDLKAINLTTNGTSTNAIVDMKLQRHLAADATVDVPAITGTCLVGDQNDPQTGHVLNPIVLDCFTGSLTCNTLDDFTVAGECLLGPPPSLDVNGDYAKTLTIHGSVHRLLVGGLVTGKLLVTGSVLQEIDVGGVRDYGEVEVAGNVKIGRINGGIDVNGVVRLGSVGPQINQAFQVRSSNAGLCLKGRVLIAGDASDVHVYGPTEGALDIGGNVQIAGFDSDITATGTCHIHGDVTRYVVIGRGGEGPIEADVIGTFKIDGDFDNPEYPCHLTLHHGDILGDLTIGGRCGADLLIPEGTISGSLLIDDDMTGQLVIGDDEHPQALTGSVTINGGLSGAVVLEGSLSESGSIHVAGNVDGAISMHGDIDGGTIEVGALDDPEDPSVQGDELNGGHIIVTGSLLGSGGILCHYAFPGSTEFITIDYDGWHPSDNWIPPAAITVGNQTFYENDPNARVMEITSCKGDMNNDAYVDLTDINGMIAAVQGQQVYAQAYPGRGGAWLFKGDTDCDGDVDFEDIDAFVARLGCCDPNCPGCPPGGDGLQAQELAAGLLTHVPEARHATLRAFVAQMIAHHHDRGREPQRVYWSQVLAHLSE